MDMLSTLLPGVRHLRASLVTGYLLLATAWLTFRERFIRADTTDELGQPLSELVQILGRAGLLAVITLIAYLLGSAYVTVARKAAGHITARATQARFQPNVDDWPRYKAWRPFTVNARKRLERLAQDTTDSFSDTDKVSLLSELDDVARPGTTPSDVVLQMALLRRLSLEILYGGGKRLLVSRPELHTEYDRILSEAELRDGLALPFIAFIALVTVNMSLPIVTELVLVVTSMAVVFGLFMQARSQDRDANSIMAHGIVDGVVSTPTLDSIRAIVGGQQS